MRWLVAAAAMALLASGCFASCGPSSGSVLAEATIAAGFAGNETALRQSLVEQGFTVAEFPTTLDSRRPGLRVSVNDALDGTLQVVFHFDGESKEFPDTPAGREAALSHSAERIEETRPMAQGVLAALAEAVDASAGPLDMGEPGYAIC